MSSKDKHEIILIGCPKCGVGLQNFNWNEGGWCPACEEWYPADLVVEALANE